MHHSSPPHRSRHRQQRHQPPSFLFRLVLHHCHCLLRTGTPRARTLPCCRAIRCRSSTCPERTFDDTRTNRNWNTRARTHKHIRYKHDTLNTSEREHTTKMTQKGNMPPGKTPNSRKTANNISQCETLQIHDSYISRELRGEKSIVHTKN